MISTYPDFLSDTVKAFHFFFLKNYLNTLENHFCCPSPSSVTDRNIFLFLK
jgi:hypothetical protein